MTKKEKLECAIHCMKVNADIEVCEECNAYNMGECECRDIAREAIKALEEVQEYQKIGTVENLKTLCDLFGLNGFKKLEEYQKIGTVEECREAVEKQKPKKPLIGADFMAGRDDEGEPIWEHDYVCPDCGLGISGEYICCPYCGTYIDWSDERE